MEFRRLAEYLQNLENTSSRLEITRILAELFKRTDKNEIDKVVYLVLGSLAPNYQGIVLNLAERMMLVVIAQAFDTDLIRVKELYKQKGDLGNVAQSLAPRHRGHLSVTQVHAELLGIAATSGAGSQEKKVSRMAKLLSALDSASVRFVARIPVGRLRLGFSDKTIIDALSLMEKGDKSAKKGIEAAYNTLPDIGIIAKLVKEKGVGGLARNIKPALGVPIAPMLAQRLGSTTEMIKKMGQVAVEPKFDGLRIFIHFRRKDNFLRIFTRNLNAIPNDTFPELAQVGKYLKAKEVILDTEAVGIDPRREMFLDFQKTIQRRRKHDIQRSSTDIPLQFQVFDILLVDGRSLLSTPYRQRRQEVERAVVNGSLMRVDESTLTRDPEVIKALHQKYLKMGLEGIIAKKADSLYVSGRTGWNWVKMKEKEGQAGKLADTVDCVIMGFSVGKGKRVAFGTGQFLAGIKDGEKIKSITKVGTGLTDVQFRELNTNLKKIVVRAKPQEYEVHKDLTPDYWVAPEVVVELAADEITVSPKHTAGFALRFPRLVRFRDDKSAGQATTLAELQYLYRMQKA